MDVVDVYNNLNELSELEWLKFTKSWFVDNSKVIENFIKFFSKSGGVVLDPLIKKGETLVSCYNSQRNGIGICDEKYSEIIKERLKKLEGQLQLSPDGCKEHCKQLVLPGNPEEIETFWRQYSLPEIDMVISNIEIGNEVYENFLDRLENIFLKVKPKVKEGGYLVIILQNYLHEGEYKPLAWDLALRMSRHYTLKGERILCEDKDLLPSGYKYSFVPNIHHHYCLIFRKD